MRSPQCRTRPGYPPSFGSSLSNECASEAARRQRAHHTDRARIRLLFLLESIALSTVGGLAGLIIGASIAGLLKLLISGLPVNIPWDYVLGALCLSILIGLMAGVIPAMRAAKLNPVDALRTE